MENAQRGGKKPSLLLHSCCAPCSSSVIEQLEKHVEICVFFYNPNILPKEEYGRRLAEQKRFLLEKGIALIEGEYEPDVFLCTIRGLEHLGEKSERCRKCYRLRLEKAFRQACEGNFDFFTTTLSVSPHKKADWINEILENLAESGGSKPLLADFKKGNGYKRSLELSKEYQFYRQNYCGCNLDSSCPKE